MKNNYHIVIIALVFVNLIFTAMLLKNNITVDLNESSAAELTATQKEFVRYLNPDGTAGDKLVSIKGVSLCPVTCDDAGIKKYLKEKESQLCDIRSDDQSKCSRDFSNDKLRYEACINSRKAGRSITKITIANSITNCCAGMQGQAVIQKVTCPIK